MVPGALDTSQRCFRGTPDLDQQGFLARMECSSVVPPLPLWGGLQPSQMQAPPGQTQTIGPQKMKAVSQFGHFGFVFWSLLGSLDKVGIPKVVPPFPLQRQRKAQPESGLGLHLAFGF